MEQYELDYQEAEQEENKRRKLYDRAISDVYGQFEKEECTCMHTGCLKCECTGFVYVDQEDRIVSGEELWDLVEKRVKELSEG